MDFMNDMNLRDWLRNYNLGMEHFARLIGAGKNTIIKYEKGDSSITQKSREKIEKGMFILWQYNLVAPKWDGGLSGPWNMLSYGRFDENRRNHAKDVQEYDKRFKELFEKEEALT